MSLKFGRVSYINSVPLFCAESGGFDIVSACPADLNLGVRRGELDVSLISRWEYLDGNISEFYKIIPNYCIAGDGEIMSVKIFSKVPIDGLRGRKIFITRETGTSSRAFRFLILKKYGFDIFTMATNMPDEADALLLIGNSALEYANPKYPFSTDLGEMWKEVVGLKMIYAVAVARREIFDSAYSIVSDYFSRSLKIFDEQREQKCVIARELFRKSENRDISLDVVRQYYCKLIYKLTSDDFAESINFVSKNGRF